MRKDMDKLLIEKLEILSHFKIENQNNFLRYLTDGDKPCSFFYVPFSEIPNFPLNQVIEESDRHHTLTLSGIFNNMDFQYPIDSIRILGNEEKLIKKIHYDFERAPTIENGFSILAQLESHTLDEDNKLTKITPFFVHPHIGIKALENWANSNSEYYKETRIAKMVPWMRKISRKKYEALC